MQTGRPGTTLHGLSRDVTLAVLPRLYIEELVAELARRNINFGGYSIKQEFLVGVLKDIMTQEYRNLEAEKHPSDDVADDKNIDCMPDEELAQREQFQCEMLHSQTLSRICPSSDVESGLATETTAQFQDEKNIGNNQENSSKVDDISSEAFPEATASWNGNMLYVRATEDAGHTESRSDGTESLTSVTTRPISLLDNICSPKTELEDHKTPNDEELYSNDNDNALHDSCLQSRNSRSSSDEDNAFVETSDNMVYSRKDCEYRTNERSDFLKHTRINNASLRFGIKHKEQDHTSQTHLPETEQEMETIEGTTMVVDPSNTVTTDEHIQGYPPMTEHVPENSDHVRANCNDGKAALGMDSNADSNLYEVEVHGSKTHNDESDYHDFDDEKKSSTTTSSGNNSITRLELQGTTLYECKQCDYRTKVKDNLVKHTKIHIGEKPFMCTYCDYRTARRDYLKAHMYRHSGEKPYQCSVCDFKTRTKYNLVEHMRKHTGEKPYKCDECGFKTVQKGNLVKHIRKHTGEKPYICGECGFQTAHKTGINYHMKKHTGDKRHVCNVCGHRAIQKANLVIHQRKHTGEKPFVCGDCGYKSSYKSALATHMKRHTTDGIPLSCDQCGFMTTSNSKLVTHKRVHHVDKPRGNVGDD